MYIATCRVHTWLYRSMVFIYYTPMHVLLNCLDLMLCHVIWYGNTCTLRLRIHATWNIYSDTTVNVDLYTLCINRCSWTPDPSHGRAAHIGLCGRASRKERGMDIGPGLEPDVHLVPCRRGVFGHRNLARDNALICMRLFLRSRLLNQWS
jgi:hypothetical protein